MSSAVRAYELLLHLYPAAFRRRYAVEMRLDFEDALRDARAGGAASALLFGWWTLGDVCMSLSREWAHSGRVLMVAATAGITLLLWGMALRPWAWHWDAQPRRRPFAPAPIDAVDLLIVAAIAMLPVVVVILFAHRLTDRGRVGRPPRI